MNHPIFQPAGMPDPPAADDFSLIRGIGASIAERLHQAGILTYAQLAEKTPEEIAAILDNMVGMTARRIAGQDWPGQASQLAAEQESPQAAGEPEGINNQQRYAVFTVELLLDGDNQVRRTKIMHVQSHKERTWASWDGGRLQDFIREQAMLQVPSEGSAGREIHPPEERPPTQPTISPEQPSGSWAGPSGRLKILSIQPIFNGDMDAKHLIPANQSFRLRLSLDLSEVQAPDGYPIQYSASLYARKLGTSEHQTIGSSSGEITALETVDVDVDADGLAPGIYRLEATVMLSLLDQRPQPGYGPVAMIEAGLFQVY